MSRPERKKPRLYIKVSARAAVSLGGERRAVGGTPNASAVGDEHYTLADTPVFHGFAATTIYLLDIGRVRSRLRLGSESLLSPTLS